MYNLSEMFNGQADQVFLGGKVITIDPEDRVLEALAIKGNRIMTVGSNAEVEKTIGPSTKVTDLGGRTLMPGIIDTHLHLILGGLLGENVDSGMINTSYRYCPTFQSMMNKLSEAVKQKQPGEWVSMMGYEPLLFEDVQRHPSLQELDDLAPNNPVHCMHGGGHISVYNSKALEYLGVYSSEDAKKYPEGEVEVVDGKLTGMVYGHTHFKLWSYVGYSKEQQEKAALKSQALCLENGITSVCDMGELGQTSYHLLSKLTREGRMKLRITMALHSIFGKEFSLAENDHWLSLGFLNLLGDEHFRIGACKFMIDGGSGGPSCYTREPYSHDPSMKRETGWGRQESIDYIRKIHESGNQCTAHAIGDGAVEYMVAGYEACFADDPEGVRQRRHRIEHCTLVDQDLIDRMAKMNICPSVNAGMVQMLGKNYTLFYGDRNRYLGALRSMLDAGIHCSLHSDYPSGPVGLNTIDAAVNRYDRSKNFQCDKTQAVSLMEALRIATYNGAYASFEENIKGSLEVGKLADLIVLSDDILSIDPFDIYKLKVDLTLIDGETLYERDRS